MVGRGRTVGRFVGTCALFRAENYFYWPPAALAGAVDSLPTTEQSTRASDGLGLLRFSHSRQFSQMSFAFKIFDQFVLKPDIWIILALLYQLSLCLMQPLWEKQR